MNKYLQQFINFIFQLRLKKQLKTTSREKRFVSYQKAKSILLLFESDYMERNPDIRQLIQAFNADGKKVMAWGYVRKKEISSAILPDFRILHQKDADFTGFPNVDYRRELNDLNFDLLIDITVNEVKPLQYLAFQSNAACKVGTQFHKDMYDVVVDVSELKAENDANETETTGIQIYERLIFYLKSIQSID